MTLSAQKLRQACARLEGINNDEEKRRSIIDPNNNYSNKLRESCMRFYNEELPENSELSAVDKELLCRRTSSGARHSKFLLAKLELQKLKEIGAARNKEILNYDSIESNDIYYERLITEANHKMFCHSPDSHSSLYSPTSYTIKLEQSKSEIKPKFIRSQPKSILKKYSSHPIDEFTNTIRKSSKRKGITLDHLIVFWDCAREGDISSMKKIFEHIPNVNEANSMGVTALHSAASIGNLECVEFLISKNCDVNCSDINGWTALHYAADAGYTEVCDCLITNGANVFVKTYDNYETPIDLCRNDLQLNIRCFEFLKKIMQKMRSNKKKTYYATHNYKANFTDELSFKKGEVLKILKKTIQKDPEYLLVENKAGFRGFVPKIFLTIYPINMASISQYN